ncbi:EmrB/QacA subfamily drug resistance transporter [Mucilaginibacter yixingensis]|uniref:EmrB/QacA subfamily drug resistance transporter n=1 Tax=Mucilaginibacter yixingensis TaxID=1295612 RepID=A0A2T5JED8_9SPHI|nr:MFS transporter [Mucilaginibacter yixingensis]PTR00807.1 EmrB/QacA subfamily drug resistance transporter [Mucilaginibacter yixingensis]
MERLKNSRWFALIIVLTAPFLSLMDVFIVNIAIPAIKKGIGASDAELQIVIAGYLLGYAAFLITGGRFGDHFGRKKIFLWGMALFTLASAWCGLSHSAIELNIARFLQGASASFMVPQTISYIQLLFTEPEDRAKAIGTFGLVLGLASMAGQFLGGFFTYEHFAIAGWRLIFFINVPVGIIALTLGGIFIQETPMDKSARFDVSGAVILTLALFALIIPIIQGRELGWPLWCILGLALSAVLFGLFVFDQKNKLKNRNALLVNFSLFKIKDLNIGLLCVLFCYMVYNSYLLISTLILQNGYHFNALLTGCMFVMFGVGFSFSSFFAMRLVTRIGKTVLQVGTVMMMVSIGLQIFLFQAEAISPQVVFLLILLHGLSAGWVMPPILNVTLKSVPHHFAGAASGLYATVQQAAGALGVSIIGGVFFNKLSERKAMPDYHLAFRYAAGLEFLMLVVLFILLIFIPGGKTSAQHISE